MYKLQYNYILCMHCNGFCASGTSMFASHSTPLNPVRQVSEAEAVMYKYIPSTYKYKHSMY